MFLIRPFQFDDIPSAAALWNDSVRRDEVVFKPADPDLFRRTFWDADCDVRPYMLAAEEDGRVIGFIVGACKTRFLPGETAASTPGYLVALYVDREHRGRGVGSALFREMEDRMRKAGKARLNVSEGPIELGWRIPGAPGHDHNKAPGMDLDCPGYGFALRRGFEDRVHEVAMYLNLNDYVKSSEISEKQKALSAAGIRTGRYDVALRYDFDRMCDRVGSEYWRSVLREETAKENPRPILAATCDGHIVGFTGPVDVEPSGRGWFTGICTDPEYERRGIGTVLFNLLMEEFIAVGARFSTLYTGEQNWAQKIYRRAGFRPVRRFAVMSKAL
ncbi:MAG: GNAT family N-acetyltransferase [Clostridia bacterium]|nr:GNAT family N-acetyltransferase [Clostridia bacterium]